MKLSEARVVVFGGGTGSFTLLQALKRKVRDLTAVVTMADDGGSTGVLRDELGVLPPGDIRQCLVALSDSAEVRKLFSYRFDSGRLAGQSLGNMILSGLELEYGSFSEAIRVASEVLHIHGRVLPVTLGNHRLRLRDGRRIINGEHNIDTYAVQHQTAAISLEPRAVLNLAAAQAIAAADLLVIAPGNMYCSILPILAVDGFAEAFRSSAARKVYIANLVNKPRHTDGWHVVDYVHQLERYLGDGVLDTVFYNNALMPEELASKYAADGEVPVDTTRGRFAEIQTTKVAAALVAPSLIVRQAADQAVKRTLIRHDAEKVCRLLATYLRRTAQFS